MGGMEMFASLFLSSPEIIIILILALILFGPQKLPEIGRQIGSAMRELRKMSGEVQRALDIDEYSHGGQHNSYDAGQWYEETPTVIPSAPVGPVVAHSSTNVSILEPVEMASPAHLVGETAFVAPPGPRAQLEAKPSLEPERPIGTGRPESAVEH